jgi:hypothetical protein
MGKFKARNTLWCWPEERLTEWSQKFLIDISSGLLRDDVAELEEHRRSSWELWIWWLMASGFSLVNNTSKTFIYMLSFKVGRIIEDKNASLGTRG